MDHVYPRAVRGEYCYCEARRWAVEPPRRQLKLFDDDGHVIRTVRKPIMTKRTDEGWTTVCLLQECGHIVVKTSDRKAVWIKTKTRCRMCERIFTELEAETKRVDAQNQRKREKEMAAIRLLLARKRIVIRRPKRKQLTVTVRKGAGGRGAI